MQFRSKELKINRKSKRFWYAVYSQSNLFPLLLPLSCIVHSTEFHCWETNTYLLVGKTAFGRRMTNFDLYFVCRSRPAYKYSFWNVLFVVVSNWKLKKLI